MFRVIKHFTDLTDNNYPYQVGDKYPREGLRPNPNRYRELSTDKNKQGVPLIQKVDDPPTKKGGES